MGFWFFAVMFIYIFKVYLIAGFKAEYTFPAPLFLIHFLDKICFRKERRVTAHVAHVLLIINYKYWIIQMGIDFKNFGKTF